MRKEDITATLKTTSSNLYRYTIIGIVSIIAYLISVFLIYTITDVYPFIVVLFLSLFSAPVLLMIVGIYMEASTILKLSKDTDINVDSGIYIDEGEDDAY